MLDQIVPQIQFLQLVDLPDLAQIQLSQQIVAEIDVIQLS